MFAEALKPSSFEPLSSNFFADRRASSPAFFVSSARAPCSRPAFFAAFAAPSTPSSRFPIEAPATEASFDNFFNCAEAWFRSLITASSWRRDID